MTRDLCGWCLIKYWLIALDATWFVEGEKNYWIRLNRSHSAICTNEMQRNDCKFYFTSTNGTISTRPCTLSHSDKRIKYIRLWTTISLVNIFFLLDRNTEYKWISNGIVTDLQLLLQKLKIRTRYAHLRARYSFKMIWPLC